MIGAEGEQVLLRVIDRSQKIAHLSDRELAQVLIDLTDEMSIDTYMYNLLMETAERICVELFDEADPQHPSFIRETVGEC